MYQLISEGASPLSLAETKAYLKVTSSSQDDIIQRIISTAVEYGERYTGRQFRANTWALTVADFPDCFRLIKPPVASVTSITRLVAGVPVSVPAVDYYLVKHPFYGAVAPSSGAAWPMDQDNRQDAVVVTFVSAPFANMQIVKSALLRHIAQMYSDRGDCGDVCTAGIESGAHALYNAIRIPRI